MLTRRRFLVVGAVAVTTVGVGACSSRSPNGSSEPPGTTPDYSERFAAFEAAVEPNGDPSKVVWPAFVTGEDPEVQRLYEFQITHGELMRYMPCFCGCGEDAGHRSNRDCYVKSVDADGTVVLDSMAPT
jgi:hypothetical protein